MVVAAAATSRRSATSSRSRSAVGPGGAPVLLKDVAHVTIGPEIRRGLAEWNGEGETVGGIVVVRSGADTLATIARVKERLAELQAGLPDDVEISVGYDRTRLIERAVETLTHTLIEESIIVALVCILFLFHFRSAFVAILSIPVSILLAFVVMKLQGLGANIMSLGGIAISIGVLVDAAMIMVENAHKHYEEWHGKAQPLRDHPAVGPGGRADPVLHPAGDHRVVHARLHPARPRKAGCSSRWPSPRPTPWQASAIVAVTVVPVLMFWFVRGKIRQRGAPPGVPSAAASTRRFSMLALKWRWVVVVAGRRSCGVDRHPFAAHRLGVHAAALGGRSALHADDVPGHLHHQGQGAAAADRQDHQPRSPRWSRCLGKIGRAETATDPAPLSMIETTIVLKDPVEWRQGLTKEKLIDELDAAIQFPGLTNAWTMPIKTRIDMLSTGIKTPVGIKVAGPDLDVLEQLAKEIEAVVKPLPGTLSAYAERVMGGNYLDFDIDREAAARFGLTVGDVQDVIQSAIGGMNVGLDRRGPRALPDQRPLSARAAGQRQATRRDPGADARRGAGSAGTARQISTSARARRPSRPKTHGPTPGSTWTCTASTSGRWVEQATAGGRAREVELPAGYTIFWSGQYEYMERARQRLLDDRAHHPVADLPDPLPQHEIVIKTAIVLLAVPFSLVGAVWLLSSSATTGRSPSGSG